MCPDPEEVLNVKKELEKSFGFNSCQLLVSFKTSTVFENMEGRHCVIANGPWNKRFFPGKPSEYG